MSEIGHNSKEQLISIIDRIENLEAEKANLAVDIREIYAEAKGNGYSVPALRALIKIRKEDANKRAERESLLEVYMQALGMLSDTPLGQAAMNRAVA